MAAAAPAPAAPAAAVVVVVVAVVMYAVLLLQQPLEPVQQQVHALVLPPRRRRGRALLALRGRRGAVAAGLLPLVLVQVQQHPPVRLQRPLPHALQGKAAGARRGGGRRRLTPCALRRRHQLDGHLGNEHAHMGKWAAERGDEGGPRVRAPSGMPNQSRTCLPRRKRARGTSARPSATMQSTPGSKPMARRVACTSASTGCAGTASTSAPAGEGSVAACCTGCCCCGRPCCGCHAERVSSCVHARGRGGRRCCLLRPPRGLSRRGVPDDSRETPAEALQRTPGERTRRRAGSRCGPAALERQASSTGPCCGP